MCPELRIEDTKQRQIIISLVSPLVTLKTYIETTHESEESTNLNKII